MMRALRFHGNKDIRVDRVSVPELRPGWVKIKNAWSGICGSDLHEYTIGPMNTTIEPHALTGESLPAICGHEFSGTIIAIAPDVNDISIGTRVAVFPILSDNSCYWCGRQNYGLCKKWGFLGYSGYGGGMAEYVCVERRACHVLPDNVPLDIAALVEPLAVGWHAVREAKVVGGDHCLVLGAGPIGISVVHCLAAHGVTSITVSEPSALRLSQAREAGATHTVDPSQVDVVQFCGTVSDGLGPHAVFECAGIPAAFNTAVDAVRGRGVIVNVAIYETEFAIKAPNTLSRRQITVRGSNTYTRFEFDEVIGALATGRIKGAEKMITKRVPLSRVVEDGFMELLHGRDKHVKILVNPQK